MTLTELDQVSVGAATRVGSAGAPRARAIAFYLPQFHPVPENDLWWGPGFSEWTNTAKARPLFRGHDQPHIPADLGFYDLRCPETRQAQADLARRYGVEAFCYWHYWFGGRRMLNRPFDEVLTSGQPDHGFCLGWANHSWTGAWDGAHNRILIEQVYPGPEDDSAHFAYLLRAFEDRRYIKVEGRPLFYIFRPDQIPDPKEFCARWQQMAKAAGFPGLYIVAEISDLMGHGSKTVANPEELGYDGGNYVRMPIDITPAARFAMRFRRKFLHWPETWNYSAEPLQMPEKFRRETIHPCIYANWDNTPRAGRRGLVIRGSRPELFQRHAEYAVEYLALRPADHRLLFIKSWNEWAEGNYLEPDRATGHGNLRALAAALGVAAAENAGVRNP